MSYLGPSLRRRRRPQPRGARVALALLVSLLVNAGLALLLVATTVVGPARSPSAPARPIALAPLSAQQWEANRRAAPARPGDRPPPPLALRPLPPAPPPPPPQRAPGQVVDVAPSKDATPPKDSRFVSDHDSTVEKETRSRHAQPGYENTLPKPAQPKPSAPQPREEAQARASTPAAPERAGVRKPGAPAHEAPSPAAAPAQRPRDRVALRLEQRGDLRLLPSQQGVRGSGDAVAVPGPAAPPQPPGEAGERGAPGARQDLQHLDLRPSASTYDRLAGGPAPDKLDGIEEGEGTYLNTREWKYAGYFNRIKQAVATQWRPVDALQLRDPTGERFAYKDRVTVLAVTLDAAGSLKDVHVQRSSGVDFLDVTAVDAFRKAQPFVNPPRGLADDRGEIAFQFGFYLEVGAGVRLFRGPAP